MELNQYQVVLVNLDPTMGSEIRKIRHCVIISPVEMNRHLKTVVVAPITTTIRTYPTRVKVRLNKKPGWIAIDQIRTIDRRRIIKSLGSLSPGEILKVKVTIREAFVD
ncbi:type II toxin-antitoxin system PemK/MazF family toxin [Bacteroidota bacterium]